MDRSSALAMLRPPPPARPPNPDPPQVFTLFPLLPLEIRVQIWQQSIAATRMHFVKLENSRTSWGWLLLMQGSLNSPIASGSGGADDTGEIAAEVEREAEPRPMGKTRLVPIAPDKRSDISSHHDLQRQLRTLALSCRESRAIVKGLVSRPGTLRLGDASILSLAGSSDIVFLDYCPVELYESGYGLGIALDCPELDLIRRVAVRFSHHWQNKTASSVCIFCGQAHNSLPRRPVFPTHLYHFLARHLPNLEQFYFLDYLVVRKQLRSPGEGYGLGQGDTASLAIKCGNRTFYEANTDDWHIEPPVLRVKSWLEDRFVRYAKTSRLATHRSPERVRFGILACEHAIVPPISLQSKPMWAECWFNTRKRRLEDAAHRRTQASRRRIPRRCQQRDSEARPVPPESVEANSPGHEFKYLPGSDFSAVDFTFRLPPAWETQDSERSSPDQG